MASVTLPGTGGSITFKYDPFGRRIQKAFTQNSTTTTTNYLYDGSNAIADIDQNGNVLARYAETQNIDEPLAELRSGTTSYYEADGLGSVTSLTSGAGAIANTYTYDSFGNLTASTGSISESVPIHGARIRLRERLVLLPRQILGVFGAAASCWSEFCVNTFCSPALVRT